jgi:hypothetical protein
MRTRNAVVLLLCLVACGEKGGVSPSADKPLGQPQPPAKIASAAPSAVAPPSGTAAPQEPVASASGSASQAVASATGSGSAGPAPVAKVDAKPEKLDKLPRGKKGILTQAQADKLIQAGTPPIVTLIEAGSAPREKLLYSIAKGATYKGSLSLDMAVTAKAPDAAGGAGASQEMKSPRVSLTLVVTAADRNDKDEVNAKVTLSEMTMDASAGPQIAEMNAQFAKVKGLEMSYWLRPDGRTRDFAVKLPADVPKGVAQQLDQQLKSAQIDQLMVPMPKEDVGVGAKWTVLSRASIGGVDAIQLATYTLAERKGTTFKLGIEIDEVSGTDAFVAPAGQGKAKLLAFSSSGKGEVEGDLKALGPKTSKMSVKKKLDLEAGTDAKKERGLLDMSVGLELKQK